jgi:lipid II:glycine glycyltransferase (peptidoglycan interpeptide bridge formation enzyme)
VSEPPFELSRALRDEAWDAFVARAPGGHHLQTSRWGQVKALFGWRAARAIVRRDGEIVAGCQVLLRGLRGLGTIAYGPRAPLVAHDDRAAEAAVLDGLDALVAAERVRLVKLQAPVHRGDLGTELERRGFRRSRLEAAPEATILVDLQADDNALLKAMRASTRSNIRKAERKGVSVRAGGGADLPTFATLVTRTSERQGFAPYPRTYYERIWNAFAPEGNARLLLAEHDGDVLSAVLIVGFGDTAVYKMGGWVGARVGVHPNELLHWTGMRWARDRGHCFYDLEGIPVPIARALLRGAQPPAAAEGTTRFKLGFGGAVQVFPGAYDRARPRILAPAGRAAGSPRLRGMVHRVLGRG